MGQRTFYKAVAVSVLGVLVVSLQLLLGDGDTRLKHVGALQRENTTRSAGTHPRTDAGFYGRRLLQEDNMSPTEVGGKHCLWLCRCFLFSLLHPLDNGGEHHHDDQCYVLQTLFVLQFYHRIYFNNTYLPTSPPFTKPCQQSRLSKIIRGNLSHYKLM